MIVYMIYFQSYKSEALLNSPYNTRQNANADRVIRGKILARDGTILAYTDTDEEENDSRVYPYNNLFAQVVGYSDYGSSGLEATQTYVLMESHTEFSDRIVKDLNNEKQYGDDLVTSLDVNLQQAAYDALGNRKGAVIILDAATSKVLACVSQPDFNPNTVYEDWEALNEESAGSPFLNRALQGLYEPGSTFKIVTALAYLNQYGTDESFAFECDSEYTQAESTIHCAGFHAHGAENLTAAFANSCNCAFAYLATQLLAPDVLYQTAEALRFNTEFSCGLPMTESIFTLEETGANGITMLTAIGQGNTLVTPVQMAMISQAVYNNGIMLEPSFIMQSQSNDGNIVEEKSVNSMGQVMTSYESEVIKSYMRNVVETGTASSLSSLPYAICGKTGTAEYENMSGYVHSWFTGFTNTGNNDIVVAVIVEEAYDGESPAVSMAGDIFAGYFGG